MGMIKTRKEIQLLKKSAAITNSCLPLIKNLLKKNVTEREIAREIRKKIYSQNARLAFQTLVACGKRSARIHPKPWSTNKIISGIGYVDFGSSYRGYKTDVTVPFIKGEVSKRETKIVKAVLKAYDLATRSIKIGMPCWMLHDKVDKFLKKRGFRMDHSLGHGLGLNIHEFPIIGKPRKRLSKKKMLKWEKLKKIVFQKGTVFTIEPGVYVRGIGGCRLENDILLTKAGPKILTRAELIETN
jgi:Xaa-Pro aminopeptidase